MYHCFISKVRNMLHNFCADIIKREMIFKMESKQVTKLTPTEQDIETCLFTH